MRVLLYDTIRFLLGAVRRRGDVEGELGRAIKHVMSGRPMRRLKIRSAGLIQAGSRLLFEWHCEPRFVDSKTGCPRPLPLEADRDPSLTELLVRNFPRLTVQNALAWMEEHRGIARQFDGRYLPLRRCIVIGESPWLAGEAVVGAVSAYLEAGLHSVLTRDSSARCMDRMICVPRYPAKNVEFFRRFAEWQMHSQMDALQELLESHEVQDTDGPCVPVRVHCYIHIGRAHRSAGRRRRLERYRHRVRRSGSRGP
jgi:hypothetical protein